VEAVHRRGGSGVSGFRWAVREVDRGLDGLRKQLQALRDGDSFVKAGVVGKKAQADHGGISDGDLAMVHEFGATIQRGESTIVIPERSFVRSTFDAHRADYIARLRAFIGEVYDGRTTLPRVLQQLGSDMARDMRRRIDAHELSPLAPSTIERKGSDTPLLDTGRLREAITDEVVVSGDKR
jgi:hypothetical protein